jgi:hypothetical protein
MLYVTDPDGNQTAASYMDVEKAYEEVVDFIRETNVVEQFEHDPHRFSAMAIEIRKDLLWKYHRMQPVPAPDAFRERVGRFLAKHIARAITIYIDQDARSSDGWQ